MKTLEIFGQGILFWGFRQTAMQIDKEFAEGMKVYEDGDDRVVLEFPDASVVPENAVAVVLTSSNEQESEDFYAAILHNLAKRKRGGLCPNQN